jgi:YD repeat-containing protein
VADPSNFNTINQYDGLSDLTIQTSPGTGTTTRTFDAAGNVLTCTDAKGITATNTYRAGSPAYHQLWDTTQNATYTYDDANSVTGCSTSCPKGRLTRVIENSVTRVCCYDAYPGEQTGHIGFLSCAETGIGQEGSA